MLVIQSNFSWTALVLPNISPYFWLIIPLLEHICNDFILSVKMDNSGKLQSSSWFTHSTFLSLLADALVSLSPIFWETHDSMPRSVNKKSETLSPSEFASVSLPSESYPPQQAPTVLSPAPVQAPNPHQQLNTSPSSVCLQTALSSSAPTWAPNLGQWLDTLQSFISPPTSSSFAPAQAPNLHQQLNTPPSSIFLQTPKLSNQNFDSIRGAVRKWYSYIILNGGLIWVDMDRWGIVIPHLPISDPHLGLYRITISFQLPWWANQLLFPLQTLSHPTNLIQHLSMNLTYPQSHRSQLVFHLWSTYHAPTWFVDQECQACLVLKGLVIPFPAMQDCPLGATVNSVPVRNLGLGPDPQRSMPKPVTFCLTMFSRSRI